MLCEKRIFEPKTHPTMYPPLACLALLHVVHVRRSMFFSVILTSCRVVSYPSPWRCMTGAVIHIREQELCYELTSPGVMYPVKYSTCVCLTPWLPVACLRVSTLRSTPSDGGQCIECFVHIVCWPRARGIVHQVNTVVLLQILRARVGLCKR